MELFARLDANDQLVIELQRVMLANADRQRRQDEQQSRELEEIRKTIELGQLEPAKAGTAKKATAIVSIVVAIIGGVINHGVMNGWIPTTSPKAQKQEPPQVEAPK